MTSAPASSDGALTRTLCVTSGKGGVMKTSLAANVAGLAAAAGHRTLLVDLDPQGDLSDDLGYFADDRLDDGQHLAGALLGGSPLRPLLDEVRPGLDVVPGGEYLSDVGGALLARQARGSLRFDLLARSLAPVAEEYDLVVLDTPPSDDALQRLALFAARWLLIPTKADTSSIRAIQRVAARAAESERSEWTRILGVVLVGVPTAASRVRAGAEHDVRRLLGDVAPLLEGGVRDSSAVARETRAKGVLAHELAAEVENAEPFWKALRDGTPGARLPGSAPALADDYVRVTQQVLQRLAAHESEAGAA